MPLIFSLVICTAGVLCAAWPLFEQAQVTTRGLLIVVFSMLSYSVAAVYFSSARWNNLHLFTINGWQTFIGGLLLVPFTWYYYSGVANHFDLKFWAAVTWLAVPVSIVAVLLWLRLLKTDSIKAGMWLFLCPVFGYMIAAVIMKDTITMYTLVGVLLVMIGLLMSQQNIWAK